MYYRKSLISALSLAIAISSICVVAPDADARSRFDKATAEPSEENFKQGMKLIKEKNYEAAIDSFQQAVYFSRNHYNPNALKMLGLCQKAMRQYTKAIQTFQDQLKQTTDHEPDVWIDLAECYIELKDFDNARRCIDKSFQEAVGGKTDERQRYAQGEMYEKMGDYHQALSFYDTALDQKPLYTDAWMGRARMNVLLKNYNEALKDYRGMLEKNPFLKGLDYNELYYNMGTCFYKRGDHQGALDHWRMALDYNQDNPDTHLALAKMLDEEQHISSAIKEYQATLRTLPKESATRPKVEKRLLYLEQLLQPKDSTPVIRPSPTMRREAEERMRPREIDNGPPVPKESGF